MTTYTVEDYNAWITEHRQECLDGLKDETSVPEAFKNNEKIQTLWNTGCWLGQILKQHGATREQRDQICFAHGQRCFSQDPVEVAVKYLNEFVQTREVQEKPGQELAKKIMDEQLKHRKQ